MGTCITVSLFTREWIEMLFLELRKCFQSVSLFTREWIEISLGQKPEQRMPSSPSLRGSGLKCQTLPSPPWQMGLPLYEGVDWNTDTIDKDVGFLMSPSLRGSGLKCPPSTIEFSTVPASPSLRGSGLKCPEKFPSRTIESSPSLRGSGLKSSNPEQAFPWIPVSLFTREWIEIPLPVVGFTSIKSPSLRGSGLKLPQETFLLALKNVSLFTREWIEIL